VSDLPGRRRLRSVSTDRLVAPPFKLSTIVLLEHLMLLLLEHGTGGCDIVTDIARFSYKTGNTIVSPILF